MFSLFIIFIKLSNKIEKVVFTHIIRYLFTYSLFPFAPWTYIFVTNGSIVSLDFIYLFTFVFN